MQFTRRSQSLFPFSFRRKLNHRGDRGRALTVENQPLTETSAGVTKAAQVQALASRVQAWAPRSQTLTARIQAWASRGQTLTARDEALTARGRASEPLRRKHYTLGVKH